MITARDVSKSFADHLVLDGVEFTVGDGSVFALLGPNGAGKTTMVRILATLLEPDGGEVTVAGHDVTRDPDAVRAVIGVTGQFSAVDDLLTGRENLGLMADLNHLPRADARRRIEGLLERFELTEAADRLVGTYSGGMRRRLDLAMTLIGDPQVIFLDEPTTGLDPAAAAPSGSSSAASSRRARPCSSRPSTSTRPTSSPTGWRSSTAGRSWRREPDRS